MFFHGWVYNTHFSACITPGTLVLLWKYSVHIQRQKQRPSIYPVNQLLFQICFDITMRITPGTLVLFWRSGVPPGPPLQTQYIPSKPASIRGLEHIFTASNFHISCQCMIGTVVHCSKQTFFLYSIHTHRIYWFYFRRRIFFVKFDF